MTSKRYGLVILCIAISLYSNISSSHVTENNRQLVEYRVPANKPVIVSITGAYSDFDVAVHADQQLVSLQNGPAEHWAREFVVLSPAEGKTDYKLVLSTAHPLIPLYQPEISMLDDGELTHIDTYRTLSMASIAWQEQTIGSREQAVGLLKQALENSNLPEHLVFELGVQLIHMHLYLEQYDDALELHQNLANYLNGEHGDARAHSEYLSLKSAIHFKLARYDQSISASCEYLEHLDEAKQAYSELEFSYHGVQLAKLIIEGSRNSPTLLDAGESGFLQHYFSSCSATIKKVWHTDEATIQNYLAMDRKPIDDAKAYLDLALLKVDKWNDPQLKASILEALWFYYNYLDQHKEAELTIRLAIDSYNSTAKDETIALYYSLLGTSLMRLGRYAEGQHNYLIAIELFKKFLPESKLGEGYFALGYAYKLVGDLDSSYRRFEQSLKVTLANETKAEPGSNALCIFDFIDNKLAVSAPSNTTLLQLTAPTLVHLGIINRTKGRLTLAIEQHNCALSILQNSNEYYEVVALLELSRDYLDAEKYHEADSYAGKVIVDKRALGPQVLDARIIQLSAAVGLLDIEKAKQIISSISQEFGSPDYFESRDKARYSNQYPARQIQVFSQLIRMNSIQAGISKDNQVEFIEHYAQRALGIIRDIKNQLSGSEAWLSAQNALIHEYVEALLLLNEVGNDSGHKKIFEVLDHYYSINYSDEQKKHAGLVSGSATAELQEYWNAKLEAERNLVFASEDSKQQALDTLDRANDAYYSHKTSSTPAVEKHTSTHYSLTEIQELMPAGDIFLRYYLDAHHSFRLEVTRDTWKLSKLPNRKTIRDWVNGLEGEIANNSIRRSLAEDNIKQLLPLELLDSGQYKRIVLVPDDVLHRVPFSALNLKSSSGNYHPLASNTEVIRTHSANHFYAEPDNKNRLNSIDIAIFADPIFSLDQMLDDSDEIPVTLSFRNWSSSLARLRHTALEAENILDTYGNDYKIESSSGLEATSSWLMSERTRQAKLLHIATHGHFDPDYPQYVGIATSIDKENKDAAPGFLSLTELLSQPYSSNLVVISGCETMLGKFYNGVGTKSLTHGLISRGAGSVIGTLWKVADRPTSLFMKYFYETLKDNGGNASEALYTAKNKLSKTGRYRDPIYWAGFVLTSSNHFYAGNVFN